MTTEYTAERKTSVHDRLATAIGRVCGYRQSVERVSVSSHEVDGAITLSELSGLQKYAIGALHVAGLRVAALGDHVVVSAILNDMGGPKACVVNASTVLAGVGLLARVFGKRRRGDGDEPEAPSKHQMLRNIKSLDSTVNAAIDVAKRSNNAQGKNISDCSWTRAAEVSKRLMELRGFAGEAVCQGVSMHVSMSGGNVPPLFVAARLCGGVAIPLRNILNIADEIDGCLRVAHCTTHSKFPRDGVELPCNEDGHVQSSVGGSSLAIEIAITEPKRDCVSATRVVSG